MFYFKIKNYKKIKISLFLVLFIFGFLFLVSPTFATDNGNCAIGSSAWSEKAGFISFNGNGQISTYGVTVSSTALTGYAWGAKTGWIHMSGTYTGGGTYSVLNTLVNNTGRLSGSAWSEKAGFIKFSADDSDYSNNSAANYGVYIDGSGNFQGYAWGAEIGWIHMSGTYTDGGTYGVATTWVPNTAPNIPILVFPTNASNTADTTPTLSASYSDPDTADTGSTNYRIAVSAVNCIAGTVVASGTSSFTSTNTENTTWTSDTSIGSDAEYYWCAQNNDGSATSSWTSMGSFVLNASALSAPTLTGGLANQITATWSSNGNPDGIEYYIENTTANTNSGWITSMSWISQNLNCGTDYIFKVKARYADLTETDWSATSTVKTINCGGPIPSASNLPITMPVVPSVQQILLQVQNIANAFKFNAEKSQIKYPPIEESVPIEPQIVFQGGNIISKKQFDKISILPLPDPIKNLALKFPSFASTLEKVGISKLTDVERLKVANLSFPSLSEVVGVSPSFAFSKFTEEQIRKIPSNITFAKTGADNIDFNIKVSFSDLNKPVQSISTIQGKPLYLTVKPDSPVSTVKGYILFKSANSHATFLDFTNKLSANLSASLLDATNFIKKDEPSSSNLPEVVAQKDIVLSEFDYINSNGVWNAKIDTPNVDGKYEVRTIIQYKNKTEENKLSESLSMILVVDPEGYIYEKTNNNKEIRIDNAKVSIYWLNPETKKYELWPAKDFQQENPQTTDVTGKYSFLVPLGTYYLQIKSPDYIAYEGKPFLVEEGSGIHQNIELHVKNWWGRLFTIERVLMSIIIIMLILVFTFIAIVFLYFVRRDKLKIIKKIS